MGTPDRDPFLIVLPVAARLLAGCDAVLIVSIVATVLYYLLLIYFFVLWARFILDLLRNFSRNWRPRGIGLVLAEVVFSLTDRPIRSLRRVIPPIRIGGAALDFAWSIVMLVVIILIYITLALSESVRRCVICESGRRSSGVGTHPARNFASVNRTSHVTF